MKERKERKVGKERRRERTQGERSGYIKRKEWKKGEKTTGKIKLRKRNERRKKIGGRKKKIVGNMKKKKKWLKRKLLRKITRKTGNKGRRKREENMNK